MAAKSKSLALPVAIALVAAVALVAAILGTTGSEGEKAPTVAESTTASADAQDELAQLERRQEGDPLALGEVDAPVVLVAYSEFQCPFCGKFARDTAPTLMEKYVEDGTLRIEWRDFPYLGTESTTAALAARAAAAQDKFWEFHDALYTDPPPPNSGKVDQAYVEGLAKDVGLDLAQFRDDMSFPATREAVEADFEEGQAIGVTGTPSFLINGEPIVGAQPTKVFEQVIEEAADAAGNGR